MTVRKLLGLTLFAFALSALPHANPALADDDSEDENAPRSNFQQYGSFPNQGSQYQGYWTQRNRNNAKTEQEPRKSRFGRGSREGRDGGGGGDDD